MDISKRNSNTNAFRQRRSRCLPREPRGHMQRSSRDESRCLRTWSPIPSKPVELSEMRRASGMIIHPNRSRHPDEERPENTKWVVCAVRIINSCVAGDTTEVTLPRLPQLIGVWTLIADREQTAQYAPRSYSLCYRGIAPSSSATTTWGQFQYSSL